MGSCFHPFFRHDHYSDASAEEHLQLHTLSRGYTYHLDELFLIQGHRSSNSVLSFWKLLIFECLLCIYDIILCSIYAVRVNIVFVVDELQVLILSLWMLANLESKLFLLFIFYNLYFLIVKILNVLKMCVYIFFVPASWLV
jgi:hypothetical protein